MGRSASSLIKTSNTGHGSGFVSPSATFSPVGTYSTPIVPLSTASRMKWCRMSICLVHVWNLLFFVMAIVDMLSSHSLVTPGSLTPTSARKLLNHKISLAAIAAATYSASVLDCATKVCLLDDQLTAPRPIRTTKPDIECRSGCDAQSASEKTSGVVPAPPKVSQRSFVVLRYLINRFNASQ